MRPNRLSMVLLTLVAVSCVGLQPRVPVDSKPSTSSGYVGVMGIKHTIAGFGFGLRDEAGHEYVVPLENELRLVALPEGRYHVYTWWTYSKLQEVITQQKVPSDSSLARPFDLEAGKVVILGSWDADRSSVLGGSRYTLKPIWLTRAYAELTVRAAHPNFSEVPVSCLTCKF